MRYKALFKAGFEECKSLEYDDYTVFPLEGIWTSSNADNYLDKDSFLYTIMIRQPDFITKEMFEEAYDVVKKKKPHPLLKEVVFDTIEEGECVQILHRGSFDDEPKSFSKMDIYAQKTGLERLNHYHREIYLTDSRKSVAEKRQTILRYQVQKQVTQK